MADDVYANDRELSCKAGDGKSICAFPDVCMTPPENPATPPGVPVPYPNTGMSNDTTDGSRTVQISGKEVMLKNKSYFKQSMGDEAGCAAKKGVVTSVNRGKVYFIAWSMDVKVEGENTVRHLDMTTHNHASPGGNGPPWKHVAKMTIEGHKCSDTFKKFPINRYDKKNWKCRGSRQQKNHPVMNACFQNVRRGQAYGRTPRYKMGAAPAMCVSDSRKGSDHYKITQKQNAWASNLKKNPTYSQLRRRDKREMLNVMKSKGMTKEDAECIMRAVDAYMETIGVGPNTVLRIPG